jgi:hypothetical protein
MSLILAMVLFVALLAIWVMAWRSQPVLACGIGIGILIAWAITAMFGDISFETIPLWLPPLPFAAVAVALIVFGALAWFRAT